MPSASLRLQSHTERVANKESLSSHEKKDLEHINSELETYGFRYEVTQTASLWDAETKNKLTYIPSGLLSSAFTTNVPEAEAARAGKFTADKIAENAEKLVLWADVFGLQPKDILTLTMLSPDKKVLINKSFDINRNKAVFFQFIGIKKHDK